MWCFLNYTTTCLGSDSLKNRDKHLGSSQVPVGAGPRAQKWRGEGDQEEEGQSKSMDEPHDNVSHWSSTLRRI